MKMMYVPKDGADVVDGAPLAALAKLLKALSANGHQYIGEGMGFATLVAAGAIRLEPLEAKNPPLRAKNIWYIPLERGERVGVEYPSGRTLNAGVTLAGEFRWAWDQLPDFRDRGEVLQAHPDVVAWLATGERGASSVAMCFALFGLPVGLREDDQWCAPHDPDDFRRCQKFLVAVPAARERVDELRALGPIWQLYVEHWSDLERLYREESSMASAPKLYALMRDLRDKARPLFKHWKTK